MTDLLAQVTPLTKGIIWLTAGVPSVEKKFYKEIDYLLNGLLTATIRANQQSSNVLVGENFGRSFYVFSAPHPEVKDLINFLDLLRPQLADENNLFLIDETGSFQDLKQSIDQDVLNKIQPIQ
jgi:hypothetical protein